MTEPIRRALGGCARRAAAITLAYIMNSMTANCQAPRAPGSAPIEIGSRLELFVDRALVENVRGLEFRLQAPVPQPMPASPLKGAYATVIKDGALFRAYYRDTDPSYTGPKPSGHPGEITCYAESRDGHEWQFPNLGLFEVNGSRRNNAILAGQPPFSHNFSPFLDARPGVDPSERFKALAGHPGFQRKAGADGLHAFVSADGIRWHKRDAAAVIPCDPAWSHAFDSQNVSFWSEAEQRYVCFFRSWVLPGGGTGATPARASGRAPEAGRGAELRSISRTDSPDFRRWSPPVAMRPNRPGEHLYTSQTHPYGRAPHLYIALPTRYVAGRVGADAADPMLGSTDILFMSARAGAFTFDRLFTEAFIRPGLDPARWKSRANYAALNVVPTGPAELSLYHAGSGLRYTLRTDGFVAVHAGAEDGELLTRPLRFSGAELVLNYSTAAAGGVRVELCDAVGAPLAGFELGACRELVGDAIEQPVRWAGEPDLAARAGQPVRLRFVMREADLFSFRFGESARVPGARPAGQTTT